MVLEKKMKTLKEKKNKKMKIVWITGLILGLAVIAGISAFFILRMVRERQYTELIQEGEKYYERENYDKAIIAYRSAIEVNEKHYRGYEGLSEVYIIQQNYSMARAVLEDGLEQTDSKTLQYIYTKIENAEDGVSLETMETGLKAETAESPWNEPLLTYIGTATYKQYREEYGQGVIREVNNGCAVYYEALRATLYYQQEDGKTILNGATGEPFDGQVPSYVVFDDLSVIFSQYGSGFGKEDIQMITQDMPGMKSKEENGYYLEFTYLNCRFQIDCDANGYVADMAAAHKVIPLSESIEEDMGEIIMTVVDATTGEVVEDVTVSARAGAGNEGGSAVASVSSDMNGEIHLQVPSDTYTLEFAKEGYMTEYEEVTVRTQMKENYGTKVLSPNLGAGEWRIVLEWGDNPSDLDSHLVSDSYHISYVNPAAGQSASLDVDDMDGQGPETITISNMDTKGHYEYYVHDFTNRGNNNSNALANSGAIVKVYMPTGEIREYSVPDGTGTIWSVFTIDKGKLNEVNQIRVE